MDGLVWGWDRWTFDLAIWQCRWLPTSSICRSKKKVTMPRVATFKEYYSLLTTGVGGNENVEPSMMPWTRNRICVMLRRPSTMPTGSSSLGDQIRRWKSSMDWMNTISRLTSKVCGYIILGDIAFIGHLNYVKALLNIQYNTPTTNKSRRVLLRKTYKDFNDREPLV